MGVVWVGSYFLCLLCKLLVRTVATYADIHAHCLGRLSGTVARLTSDICLGVLIEQKRKWRLRNREGAAEQ
jgi:hypothetical protein